jgi:hypothetical protein
MEEADGSVDLEVLRDAAPRHGWAAVGSAKDGTLRLTCLGHMLEQDSPQRAIWDSSAWGLLERICAKVADAVILTRGKEVMAIVADGSKAWAFAKEKVGAVNRGSAGSAWCARRQHPWADVTRPCLFRCVIWAPAGRSARTGASRPEQGRFWASRAQGPSERQGGVSGHHRHRVHALEDRLYLGHLRRARGILLRV